MKRTPRQFRNQFAVASLLFLLIAIYNWVRTGFTEWTILLIVSAVLFAILGAYAQWRVRHADEADRGRTNQ